MEITDVKIYPTKGEKLKANCLITLDDAFVFKCKIMQGQNGPFLSMPAEPAKDRAGNPIMDPETGKQKYYDYHYPKTKTFREALNLRIIGEYKGMQDKLAGAANPQPQEEDDSLPF